jgi:hypothetical protein
MIRGCFGWLNHQRTVLSQVQNTQGCNFLGKLAKPWPIFLWIVIILNSEEFFAIFSRAVEINEKKS